MLEIIWQSRSVGKTISNVDNEPLNITAPCLTIMVMMSSAKRKATEW